MQRRVLIYIICCLGLFGGSTLIVAQSANCTLSPRLVVGDQGWVLPDTSIQLYTEPSFQNSSLTAIPERSLFNVLEGPSCVEDVNWWHIQYHDLNGWAPEGEADEYSLQPVSPITLNNAGALVELSRFGRGSITSNVLWLPDGRIVAAGSLGIWLYDGENYEATPELLATDYDVLSYIGILDDGLLISIGCRWTAPNVYAYSECAADFWDLTSKKLVRNTPLPTDIGERFAISSDGTLIAYPTYDNNISLWDINGARVLHTLIGHTSPVISLELVDDMLISGDIDGRLLMWDLDTGEMHHELYGHAGRITDIQISTDGSFAVASEDRTISSWDSYGYEHTIVPNMGGALGTMCANYGGCFERDGTATARGLGFSQDGAFLGAMNDGSITIWDAASNGLIKVIYGARGRSRGSNSIAFSPNADRVATYDPWTNRINIWNVFEGRVVAELHLGHGGGIADIAFHPVNMAIAYATNQVYLWDPTSDHVTATEVEGYSIAFNPSGTLLAAGGGYYPGPCECTSTAIRLWNTVDEHLENTLEGYGSQDTSNVTVAFNQDGTELGAVLYPDRSFSFWLTDKALQIEESPVYGTEQQLIPNPEYEGFWVSFAPNLELFAGFGLDGEVNLWSRSVGGIIHSFAGNGNAVWDLKFNNDSTQLAAANGEWGAGNSSEQEHISNDNVRIWDTASGDELAVLEHNSSVKSVVYSPDDRLIASGTDEGQLYIWDAETYALIRYLETDCGVYTAIAFSPDASLLAAGCSDGTIRLYGIYQP